MSSRDAALAAVRDRITRAATDQDPSGVLTKKALTDVEELAALTDPVGDLDAAYALGIFHWFSTWPSPMAPTRSTSPPLRGFSPPSSEPI